jgi:PAS domain-containing protein
MVEMSPVTQGIVLLAVGLGILLLTLILLRVIRRRGPISPAQDMPNVALEINRHTDAVLLVQAGGRIVYHNQAARKLLGLNREPNLDWLIRRTRPSEAFLGLCAAEGQRRFLLDDHIIQGVSYAIPYGNSWAMLVTLQRPQLLSGRSGRMVKGSSPHPSRHRMWVFWLRSSRQ